MSAISNLEKVQDQANDLVSGSVLPVLQVAVEKAGVVASETVVPAVRAAVPVVTSAAATAFDAAKGRGSELLTRLSESEEAQEVARRAALVAAAARGERSRRWPFLLAGIAIGVGVGTLVGRKTAPAPETPPVTI